jgi:hypothetical protein
MPRICPINTFTEDSLALNGILRRTRNLSLPCMIEVVRLQKRTIGTDMVNQFLTQLDRRIARNMDQVDTANGQKALWPFAS